VLSAVLLIGLHPHLLCHRQPLLLPLAWSPPPSPTNGTVVIATAEGGERCLLTPTAKCTATVFDLPTAVSCLSAAILPHAAVAATITTRWIIFLGGPLLDSRTSSEKDQRSLILAFFLFAPYCC
jgi:hypothetical protein